MHYRNKVNTLCKKARLNYYKKSIAGVQQSDSRKWWSAVKNIGGLQSSKNVSTIMFEGKTYPDADLANLLNDKFVAVGSSLSSLNWLPLPTNDIPDDF
jgi:S-formylglutathione hydrolase FrmB